MNFYRLRLLNTILLFLVGLLIGIYLGIKKDYFKFIFESFDDYKPVYYGKKKNTNEDIDLNYKSVYYKSKENNLNETKLEIKKNKNIYKSSSILETLKTSSNPMEDELDIDIENINEASDDFIDINEFVLDPFKNKGKKVHADKMILLKGEKKGNILYMYFFTKFYEKEYYINVYANNNEIIKIEDFKIGYYYKFDFISNLGSLLEGNKLLKIEPTGEKADWASGISAF